MGMYTELHLYVQTDLKDLTEFPNELYSVFYGGGYDMFRNAQTKLENGVLEIHSSFKNYNNELQKTLEIIKAHILYQTGFIGFYTTDYDDKVTAIFLDEITKNGTVWEKVILYKTAT